MAGRVTLSKAVIEAIPIYPMMSARIPRTCLNEIQKLQRNFIWGDEVNKRKAHLINWNTLMIPKGLGGLGIRKLEDMNFACIMKLGWNLRNEGNDLWCKVLLGKYKRNDSLEGNISAHPSDSPLWKSIVEIWHRLSSFECWAIGDGCSAKAWSDR